MSWDAWAGCAKESGALDAVDLALIGSLARRAGRADDLPLRAVLGALLMAVKDGALRMPSAPEAMAPALGRFLKAVGAEDSAAPPHELAAAFGAARAAGAYATVLGGRADFKPLREEGGGLYFQRYHAAESLVAERLARFLGGPLPPADSSQAEILETVLRRYPLRSHGVPMAFTAEQETAVALALRSRLTVVSGGPGTGKTALVANIVRAWARARAARPGGSEARPGGWETGSERIRLAAPTGRAAQRLAESLRHGLASVDFGDARDEAARDAALASVPCETLHRLLRYDFESGDFLHDRKRPLAADLVIVDEASMVDVFTLARLLDAISGEASLILVGDMDQLPSVEAGAVLADLVAGQAPLLEGRLVLLRSSHRSQAGILSVAGRINAQQADKALAAMALPLQPSAGPGWPAGEDGGCRFLLPGPAGHSAADFRGWLEAWVETRYGEARGAGSYGELVRGLGSSPLDPAAPEGRAFLDSVFAGLDRARILTFTRKGWHGCETANARIRERLIAAWDPHRAAARRLEAPGFHGAPIMILENDYGQDLYNGEVGVLLRVRGRHVAFFRRPGAYRAFPETFLPRHEPAFAMTVHKSQGSEYDHVLLLLPEAGNRLLYKETLYTALTRARRSAAIYGEERVFREAVGNKVERESGLGDLMRSLRDGGVRPP